MINRVVHNIHYFKLAWWVLFLRHFFMCPKFDDESLVLSEAQEEDCGKTSRAAHARKKLDRKDWHLELKITVKIEWSGAQGCGAHFKVPPRGCVEIGSHAPSSFETFMSIIHVGSQLMDSFQKVILWYKSRNPRQESQPWILAEEEEDKQFSQRLEFFTQVQTAFSRRTTATKTTCGALLRALPVI